MSDAIVRKAVDSFGVLTAQWEAGPGALAYCSREQAEAIARRAAELAREECAKEIIELGAKLHIDITKKLGRGAEGWGAACAYLAAAIRAGSGE